MCGFLGPEKLSENERGLIMGTGFLWGMMEMLQIQLQGDYTTVNILKNTELYGFKRQGGGTKRKRESK